MTNLDCSVVGCAYNSNNTCKRENITVGGHEAHKASETACKSFSPKGTNTMINGMENAKKETNVACDAVNCKYNRERNCEAQRIGISGKHAVTNAETECGSFVAR